MNVQRTIGGSVVAVVATFGLLVPAVAESESTTSASPIELSAVPSTFTAAQSPALESHSTNPVMSEGLAEGARPQIAGGSTSASEADGTLYAVAAETEENEELAIIGATLRTLAGGTGLSMIAVPLAPSIVLSVLSDVLPPEVMAPITDAYAQVVGTLGDTTTAGAEAFHAMADALRALSPVVNPAVEALGTPLVDITSTVAQAATDVGDSTGLRNSLLMWAADYLDVLGEAVGLTAAGGSGSSPEPSAPPQADG